MTFNAKYNYLLLDDEVNRWFLNLRAKSILTATVYLRTLGLYCEIEKTNPKRILDMANTREWQDSFIDFVRHEEEKGKAGSYIVRFKKVILSWLRFNNIKIDLIVNIKNEYLSARTENESVPSVDALSKILRKANSRSMASIALMAFSGLRPEVLGNFEGNDGLKIRDLIDFNIKKMDFENIPAMIIVRPNLSKARNQYFTFLGDEGCTYIKEYLIERSKYEKLTEESPLIALKRKSKYSFMRTLLITREIRNAMRIAGVNSRPYVLRAYFSTALDIAESKGLISHPWRQFIMGHKGDIESRYSTNKRLLPEMIDEMRESYKKSSRYFETKHIEMDDAKTYLKKQLLIISGYTEDDIEKIDINNITDDEFQKMLKDKLMGAMMNNGSKQKLINISDIEKYLNMGYEFQATLPNGKAVMKLPF
jgi:hypothetical protein